MPTATKTAATKTRAQKPAPAAKTATYNTLPADRLPKLQNRLILNRFVCRLLGVADFKALRGKLNDVRLDDDEDGHTHFFHTLQALEGIQIPSEKLAEYDLRIKGYVERLNRHRTPKVQLKYFQYLAALFTEIFLDRLFEDRAKLRANLNQLVQIENGKLLASGWVYQAFADDDLDKAAFWMATGSGKTLLMHLNLWQYLHYSRKKEIGGVLLITPNEGLSRQHQREFRMSGIAAERYGEPDSGNLFGADLPVTIIEITKLTENKKGSGVSVNVDEFESFGLILVDEGHRGAQGDVWRELRAKVAVGSFTFEYSATFGQIVNGADVRRRPALLDEYSKAILFDYSYPHFYEDGYGKDYCIVNVADESNDFNDWVLLGNLLSFAEQCLVYDQDREGLKAFNLETPLWVFVGHSVTGAKNKDNEASLTDMEEVVLFFHNFLSQSLPWTKRIEQLLTGQIGNKILDDQFSGSFAALKAQGKSPVDLYAQIIRRVLRGTPGEHLRVTELKQASGEIGLRAGATSPYFGVINIGDVPGLIELLKGRGIASDDDNLAGSLFNSLNATDSPVTMLIGSRKFMEGWDSFRVSSMGLLNIGKGEGSQIVQLFGRGVRLRGKGFSLKRSSRLTEGDLPPHVDLLETVNIFGVRANYMAQFREYLKEEGIETDYEEIRVPIRLKDGFTDRKLQVLRLNALFDQTIAVTVDPKRRVKLDFTPRIEVTASATKTETSAKAEGTDQAAEIRRLASLLDWKRIYLELLSFKQAEKGLFALSFTEDTLQRVIADGSYEVICPDGFLALRSFTDLKRVEDVVLNVLRKYMKIFYDRRVRSWEQDHLELVPLTPTDPNVGFEQYTLRIGSKHAAFARKVEELVASATELYEKDVTNFPNIHLDQHLYQPLLLKEEERVEKMAPPGLEESEIKFVNDLRHYLRDHGARLGGKELYLLRNLSVGKGINFFDSADGEAFYPDFILWLIEGDRQQIVFLDPHGIRNAKGLSDPKIQLFKRLSEDLEPRLKHQAPEWNVSLISFIIAPDSYTNMATTSWVRDYTQEKMEENHVLFNQDVTYIHKIMDLCLR